MPFFPTVTLEAAQVGQSPQLLTRLRHHEIDGIVVKNVYDRAICGALRIALEAGHHDLIETRNSRPNSPHSSTASTSIRSQGLFRAGAAISRRAASAVGLRQLSNIPNESVRRFAELRLIRAYL
jgi:hypothetical protein